MKPQNLYQCVLFLFLAFSLSAFAQGEAEKAEKIAVYVSGASDAGINKSLGSKLLFAITQSGKYAEIGNSRAFHEEIEKSYNGDIEQIAKIAGQHGADAVCVVGMTEAFGDYSISAWAIKTSNFQVIKSASLDRSLKSLDDLTAASNELASRLFQLPPPLPPPPLLPPPPPPIPVAAVPSEPVPQSPVAAAPAKECANKLNINEITSKIQSGFPSQLKDCSVTLAKNMALAMSPFGKKTELKEPKAFMTECTVDGIKQKLPAGSDDYMKPVESFIQNLLNLAVAAGGGLDVKKLSSAIGSMNVGDLMSEIKTKAANDPCVVDEPYTPVAEAEGKKDDSEDKKERGILSFGFRAGLNLSHLYADYYGYYRGSYYEASGSYNPIPGFQGGLLLDIAPASWFHTQHSVMYIQKGTYDKGITSHYIELLPLSLSLKLSVLRLTAGPYVGFCVDAPSSYIDDDVIDVGVNAGFGFDIGMFYIGMFYEYGFDDVSNRMNYEFYNRTFGFNLGVNL